MTTAYEDKILKSVMPKWTDEDFEMAVEVEKTLKSPGWKYIEKYFDLQKEAIFSIMAKARKEDIAWRLIGVMEGHRITAEIPHKILQESLRQREYNAKENEDLNKGRGDDFSNGG